MFSKVLHAADERHHWTLELWKRVLWCDKSCLSLENKDMDLGLGAPKTTVLTWHHCVKCKVWCREGLILWGCLSMCVPYCLRSLYLCCLVIDWQSALGSHDLQTWTLSSSWPCKDKLLCMQHSGYARTKILAYLQGYLLCKWNADAKSEA